MEVPPTPQDSPHSSLVPRLDLLCAPGSGPDTASTDTSGAHPRNLPCTLSCHGAAGPSRASVLFSEWIPFSSPHNPHPFHEVRDPGVAQTAVAALNAKGNAPSHHAK